ncbi:MAG: lamin tail domain-containing protein [Myxococcaceae bacterium]|nr:lamin tail domain-containing protein [Myxococcaceae bacterium]
MSRHFLSLFCITLLGLASPAWAQSGAKVLVDGIHAQTAGNADWVMDEDTCGTAQRYPTPAQSGITASTSETYWSGAFSAFGVDLVKKGFQVESLPKGARISYGDATNAQDLSNYKVFIVPEPNVQLTATEKSAIISFVRNGGGLFMIADHQGADRNSDGWDATEIFNDLMASASWGIHFQSTGESDNWFNDNPNSNFTNDASSPIVYMGPFGAATRGKGLGLFGSTSMTLNPSQNASAKGHIWMTAGTVGSNSKVTFATSTDGAGRIAAIGDSSPAEDPTNNCGHTTHDGWANSTYDNALLHLNAVAWLAGGGGGGGGGTDTTPPSAPGSLSATAVSSSQINLSWTASTDDVGVVDYDISRSTDGSSFSAVASTTGTSHSDAGLASSTTYWYRVTANDAAGNASAASNTASATTSAGGSPAQVILNEILANEPGSSTAGEFVEVVNVGGTSIGIGGWTITVGSTVRHTFAAGTTLGAGKAIVVFGGASGIPAGTPNAVTASTGGLVLSNSGTTVYVKNGTTTINSFKYTSSLSGTDGVSMNRNPDATATGTFVLHTTLSSAKASPGTHVNGSAF